MKLWVDADACPDIIKEILSKDADRAKTEVPLAEIRQMEVL
jgi:uncharacterized protein YaiI (UPF0178 family)